MLALLRFASTVRIIVCVLAGQWSERKRLCVHARSAGLGPVHTTKKKKKLDGSDREHTNTKSLTVRTHIIMRTGASRSTTLSTHIFYIFNLNWPDRKFLSFSILLRGLAIKMKIIRNVSALPRMNGPP